VEGTTILSNGTDSKSIGESDDEEQEDGYDSIEKNV
jgi:hypothetical protein